MEFIEAANFTRAGRTEQDIWYLVIHDEEAPQDQNEAKNIAEFFHNQPRNNNGTSAHRIVDDKQIIACVHWKDIAWAAPGANTNGMHWEQSGHVADKRRTWLDPYGTAQLNLLAEDVAAFAHKVGIQPVRLSPDQLRENRRLNRGVHRGICGHDTVTDAFPNEGTHTDPGPNFPWDVFMGLVKDYYKKG